MWEISEGMISGTAATAPGLALLPEECTGRGAHVKLNNYAWHTN